MTFNIRCGNEIKQVEASRCITLPGCPGVKLVAHRSERWRDYMISEYSTGLLCGSGHTIKHAVNKIKDRIEDRGVDYFYNCISSAKEKYGVIN